MSVLEIDAYLSRRIIWRAGRVACRAGAERSASFAVSSVSLPQNPAALTCPNARSALTELLACLREGGGRRGTWMNEKNPHPPTGRQAGGQAGRQGALTERSSSRLFSEGAVESPLVRAAPFSAPFLPVFSPPPSVSFLRLGPQDSLALLVRLPFKRRRRSPLAGAARHGSRLTAHGQKCKSASSACREHYTQRLEITKTD